jgi:hypothetical protein
MIAQIFENMQYKNGRVIEVVALNLSTGEYVVMDLEKYLKGV